MTYSTGYISFFVAGTGNQLRRIITNLKFPFGLNVNTVGHFLYFTLACNAIEVSIWYISVATHDVFGQIGHLTRHCFVEVVGVVIVRHQVSATTGKLIQEATSVMTGKHAIREDFRERRIKARTTTQTTPRIGAVHRLFGTGKTKFNHRHRDIKFRVVPLTVKLQLFYI